MRLALAQQAAPRQLAIAAAIVALAALLLLAPIMMTTTRLAGGWQALTDSQFERDVLALRLQAARERLEEDYRERRLELPGGRDEAAAAATLDSQVERLRGLLEAGGVTVETGAGIERFADGSGWVALEIDLALDGPADVILTVLADPALAALRVRRLELLAQPGEPGRLRGTLGLADAVWTGGPDGDAP